MKKYFILPLLLPAIFLKAQLLEKTALNVSYRYTGRNVLQAGLEYRFGNSYDGSIILGPSLLYTRVNDTDKFIPEMNINLLRAGLLIGVSGNPYSLEPRIGVSLFNAIFLNTGYAFPIYKEKYFKGVTFGIQLNIAPKYSKFYDKMKIM
ncbi:hypothetical protein SAMN06265171_104202 [Chryseobacterium rhizoplanae]|uniref:Outer membrane protein beta-barrel domain-containing protein n=1 Tax=Chryseobacterium rhizoplanae TaxID=1609531 RepID=A0A521D665_9FLAO|nr:hypothetical protein [Chryseobacterium rhizoplanae]SMO66591.1 hypothetical protein SAMN06265171_104202 [Chryseobacterium rhizoplanae]